MLYSAALSSISSCLSGCAANIWEDIIKVHFPNISPVKGTLVNRALVVVFAGISAGLALLVATFPANIYAISFTLLGATGSPLVGVFLLGGVTRRIEWRGAIVGTLSGLGISLWKSFGSLYVPSASAPLPPLTMEGCSAFFNHTFMESQFYALKTQNITGADPPRPISGIDKFYAISFMWSFVIGTCTMVVIGLLTSEVLRCFGVTKGEDKSVKDIHLIQWRDSCSCKDWTPEGKDGKGGDEDNTYAEPLTNFAINDGDEIKVLRNDQTENSLIT